MRDRLEAITVCVNYDDFLEVTVRENAQHFDRWVVVTSPDDKATIELCRRHNLDLVTNREFMRTNDRGRFNKGRAISTGLSHLVGDGWVVHIDADIALPARTRQALEVADLDPESIYGCDRINVSSYEKWMELKAAGWPGKQHGYHLVNLFPPGYECGTRIIQNQHGYVPIGFFQLFHGRHGIHSGWRWKDYPDTNADAAHSDIKFALHWDRRNRHLLPEMWVAHLESGHPEMGANWNGRKTPRFAPKSAVGNPASRGVAGNVATGYVGPSEHGKR